MRVRKEGKFTIFTTRADTMFGVSFMVLAPESELVAELTSEAQKADVEEYLAYVKKRTELERMSDRKVTGVSQAHMVSIHSLASRFLFGFQSMF